MGVVAGLLAGIYLISSKFLPITSALDNLYVFSALPNELAIFFNHCPPLVATFMALLVDVLVVRILIKVFGKGFGIGG